MKNKELLKKFTFFIELLESDLDKISAITLERSYKKNMIIFMEGEPGEAFYYVISGKIKIYSTYEDGKEHIVHILGPGDVFGEATLFNNIPYPASAMVYEDAEVGMIKNRDLESLVRQNPDMALNLIRVLARKLLFARQKIRDLAFNDVFARTATEILRLAKDHGIPVEKGICIDMNLSRQELADITGTTRETISRAISAFKKEKSITEIKNKLVILDEKKLRSWT